jgi:hypothetical protein
VHDVSRQPVGNNAHKNPSARAQKQGGILADFYIDHVIFDLGVFDLSANL